MADGRGLSRGFYEKYFNIFTPSAVYRSIVPQESTLNASSVETGTFGFTHLMDLSPAEVTFVANSSFFEKLMFYVMTQDRQYLDEIVNLVTEIEDGDIQIESGKVRAITRMLLAPSKSGSEFLKRKSATGPTDAPFEALVVSHEDRFLSNITLLHSAYTFIPLSRAPPVIN